MKSISNTDLVGLTVLNTRPSRQARALGQAIDQSGGQQIAFPALVIQPFFSRLAMTILASGQHFDVVIFVSANAVTVLQRLLSDDARIDSEQRQKVATTLAGLTENTTVIAVGEATANVLRSHGLQPLIPEQGDYRSEALLQLPILQNAAKHKILLVKGEGGRNLLADILRKVGATLSILECYRRLPSNADPQHVSAGLERGVIDIVIVTSIDSAAALLAHFGQEQRRRLLDLPWLVLSERMQQTCRQLGCNNRLLVPAQINQQGIVACLTDWWHNEFSGQID